MYPVVIGNGRSLQSDAEIFGYKIPKGVRIILRYHYGISRLIN